jgi:hypothetical protein
VAYLTTPEAKVFRPALEATAQPIDGFESPLGMELLAPRRPAPTGAELPGRPQRPGLRTTSCRPPPAPQGDRGPVRRSPAVVLLRTAHDIRPLFENASEVGDPVARDVALAIVAQASLNAPEIFELAPAVLELLGSLDDWVDQAAFEEWENARKMVADLANAGLVEVLR